MKSNALIAVLAIALAAGGNAYAQKKANGPALTPQDYLDIQQLVARYAHAMDTGADNGNAYADLFAADGEFVGPAGPATRGHDALAALGRTGFVDGRKPALGVSHFIMNHVIEPAAGGATGKAYVVLVNIGEGGKPGGEWSNTGGHYEDAYVKTAQGWKFKRREYIPMKSERRAAGTAPAAAPAVTKAPAATGAPTAAAAPANTLTAQDYIDIRALASLYAYGLDSGAEDGTGSVYANIFAEDAEFHGPPATPGGPPFNAVGREALRKFAIPGRGTAYVRHFMTNHLIEPSPEGARGKVYLLVIDIGREDKPTSVNMGGHYEDIYVKTAEGWRIRSRNFFRSKSAQTVAAEAAAKAAR
jgi:SnoaL-like domain